jgi:hypothetical protein
MLISKPSLVLISEAKEWQYIRSTLILELLLHVLMFVHSVFCDMKCEGNAGYIVFVGSYPKDMCNSDMKNVLSI